MKCIGGKIRNRDELDWECDEWDDEIMSWLLPTLSTFTSLSRLQTQLNSTQSNPSHSFHHISFSSHLLLQVYRVEMKNKHELLETEGRSDEETEDTNMQYCGVSCSSRVWLWHELHIYSGPDKPIKPVPTFPSVCRVFLHMLEWNQVSIQIFESRVTLRFFFIC